MIVPSRFEATKDRMTIDTFYHTIEGEFTYAKHEAYHSKDTWHRGRIYLNKNAGKMCVEYTTYIAKLASPEPHAEYRKVKRVLRAAFVALKTYRNADDIETWDKVILWRVLHHPPQRYAALIDKDVEGIRWFKCARWKESLECYVIDETLHNWDLGRANVIILPDTEENWTLAKKLAHICAVDRDLKRKTVSALRFVLEKGVNEETLRTVRQAASLHAQVQRLLTPPQKAQ